MNDAQIIARAHARLRDLAREAHEITVFLTTMDRLMGPNPETAFNEYPRGESGTAREASGGKRTEQSEMRGLQQEAEPAPRHESLSESNEGKPVGLSPSVGGETDGVASRLSDGSGSVASIPPATVAQTVPAPVVAAPSPIVAAGGGAVEAPATVSPDGASEEVGGGPAAAAPHNAEVAGGHGAETIPAGEAGPETVGASPAPALEPRAGMNARVIDLNQAHPDWTDEQIAAELDCTAGYVRATAARENLTLASRKAAPKPPTTLRERVRLLHELHPAWTARLIADELGANVSSVKVYLSEIARSTRQPVAEPSPFIGEAALRNNYADARKRLGAAS